MSVQVTTRLLLFVHPRFACVNLYLFVLLMVHPYLHALGPLSMYYITGQCCRGQNRFFKLTRIRCPIPILPPSQDSMVAKRDLAQEEAPAEKKASDDDVKKKGLALITHDLKKKELIPIKVLSFIIVSGKNC